MRDAGDVYVEWIGGEAVVLHRGSGEVHYLNATAATVLAFVQEHGYSAGAERAAAHFGLGDDQAREMTALLESLSAAGIVAGGSTAPRSSADAREPRAGAG